MNIYVFVNILQGQTLEDNMELDLKVTPPHRSTTYTMPTPQFYQRHWEQTHLLQLRVQTPQDFLKDSHLFH
jgi:hypothetical protein